MTGSPGSSSGSSVSGEVDGGSLALDVPYQLAAVATATSDAGTQYGVIGLHLTDVSDLCALYTNPNAAGVAVPTRSFTLSAIAPGVATASPGTYPVNLEGYYAAFLSDASVPTTPYSLGLYLTEDDAGNTSVTEIAYSGTVTIASTTSSEVTGSYDLVLIQNGAGDGGVYTHVTGTLQAPVCAAASALQGGMP